MSSRFLVGGTAVPKSTSRVVAWVMDILLEGLHNWDFKHCSISNIVLSVGVKNFFYPSLIFNVLVNRYIFIFLLLFSLALLTLSSYFFLFSFILFISSNFFIYFINSLYNEFL